MPFLRSTLEVPAGICAILEHEMHSLGIPSLGIWAQVPHYVSTMPYPAAAVALLDGLREAVDVVVDGTGIRQQTVKQRQRIDDLIAGNDEHRSMLEQLERIPARSVPLVDEGDDRDFPITADLKQLASLGLDAFRAVEHHDRCVRGGKDSVGVLGEVSVSGRIEQVQDLLSIRELQHGRRDRDATLLLQFHPVRRGGPTITLGLDRTGTAGEDTAIEQKLLGKRRLARVGVRDDRKRSTATRLGLGIRHRDKATAQRAVPALSDKQRTTSSRLDIL